MKTQLYNDQIFTLDNVLTTDECQSIIEQANAKVGINPLPQEEDMDILEGKIPALTNSVYFKMRI